ncbi:Alpha/Beta hydrolase protein [Chaetomium tenue]|uniref:Alpha/Beta hydrolase protein n=1 Tax=Chaetomium tenue TaxID=1854479 RepID=A0ACB7PK15_9PEZI|nr:Alpha/Beta hydrolase protein [Chaetomium globosum]
MAPDPPGFFPPARSIPPLSLPHRQTFILLHGRGLSWDTFGQDFISTPFPYPPTSPSDTPTPSPSISQPTDPSPSPSPSPSLTTLRTLHPHAKFLLPLAPRHRATIYARSIIHQWFDSWHLNPPPSSTTSTTTTTTSINTTTEEWRCAPGLHDTVQHLHDLIRTEAAAVGGPHNVVLGGLSQGCAAGLVALLLWEGPALGGFWGMCGWLVFEAGVRGVLGEGEGEDGGGDGGFDPFERDEKDEGEGEEVSVEGKVVRVLREMLELEGKPPVGRPPSFDTPVFLGHGIEDDKVPVDRGRAAAECLAAVDMDTEWKAYEGLGHWYSAAMLADMASFLAVRTHWGHGNEES